MIIPLSQWDASGKLSPTKGSKSDQVASFLSNVIKSKAKADEDRQLRRAAANILGVDESVIPQGISREDVMGLQKEKYLQSLKPKKWEPQTKEEAIEYADATKKPSATEEYRNDLRSAKEGKVTWEDLQTKYPEPSKQKQIEEVRVSTLPQLQRSPDFKMGSGLSALLNPNVANIDDVTMKVIRNIKTQEDLDELLAQADEYQASGVDVNAVLEYFGQRR